MDGGTSDSDVGYVDGGTSDSDVGYMDGPRIAPVAEIGFSHRLTAYKIVGHFLVI